MSDNVFLITDTEEKQGCDFYLATVTAVSSNGIKFQLDGQSSAMEKEYKQLNTGKTLSVGDRVVVMKQSGTYIVLGKFSYDNSGGGDAEPSTTVPAMDGTASTGSEIAYARGDHVHPTDTTRAAVSTSVTNVSYDSTTGKISKTINGTTTDVVDVELTSATSGSTKLITSGAVETTAASVRQLAYRAVTGSSIAFNIPAEGASVTQTDSIIKPDHELLRWNFSESPENRPPVKLKWETADGSYTITNLGGTTSEKIRPVFGYVF